MPESVDVPAASGVIGVVHFGLVVGPGLRRDDEKIVSSGDNHDLRALELFEAGIMPTKILTPNGIPVLERAEIGSTNAEAMRLGLTGIAAPLWIRADRQIAGRGRSGRAWTSEPGNHYASLLIRLGCQPTVLHQLSFVAAVATVAAIRRVGSERAKQDLPLRLKWPNDILIDGAKLVGILPESTLLSDKQVLAVIGVGINLSHAPDLPGRTTTCLAAHGIDVTPAVMLDALALAMSETLAIWDCGADFATIRDLWLASALPMGTPISVNAGRDIIDGAFAGLDHDGALILRDHSGYDRRMTFGDVTVTARSSDQG